jgi:NhaP-type Na+/H+ or K+/H+ antiporter
MTKENFVQILLTFIAMYSTYQISEYFGGNGIISVAVTGITIGTLIRKTIPSNSMEDIDMMWEFLAFIFTSIAFILIGLDIDLFVFNKYLYAIALSILIVLGARFLTVYTVSSPFNWKKNTIPRKWQNMIVWSGLRGAVSIMLALGLNNLGIQYFKESTAIIFGIVFFSILFQGILYGLVAERLGFHPQSPRA